MAETIEVTPTPIQRNLNDVAVELTTLALEYNGNRDPDEIERLYRKFYKVAYDCRVGNN